MGYELTEEEACLVALCSTEGVGPATVGRLLEAARAGGRTLEELLALTPAGLQRETGLAEALARTVAAIGSPLLAGGSMADRLRRAGADLLLVGWPEYPDRLAPCLGTSAPPVLFTLGDASLLRRKAVGIVGSRRPSREAQEAARLLASDLAAAGTVVVSGGAHGIDTAAHRGALEAGATVVLPAMGLMRFQWRGGRSGFDAEGRWCVVSEFPPHSGWRSAHALLRNRLIVALSGAVVAFEPRDAGGTWNSCLHALHMRKPLYIVTCSRRGARGRALRRLVRMGAAALSPEHMPDAEALGLLMEDYRPPPSYEQLSLPDAHDRFGVGEGAP